MHFKTAFHACAHALKSQTKLLRIMKLTAFILLSACLSVSANGYTQKITLSMRDVPLQKVFREIKKQTGYTFFYDEGLLEKTGKVSVEVKDASLQEALNVCFKNQQLAYSLVNMTVVIKNSDYNTPQQMQMLETIQTALEIHGLITDDKGSPLANVSITVKGTSKGVVSDERGNYKITAEKGDVLEFSFIGYKKQSITVTQNKTINISLEQDIATGSEVVVTALGIKRSPRSLTYSAQKVSGSDLIVAQAPTIAQGLMGKVAGLNITQASGGVEGGSSRVVVRGNTNITGDNRALIIVDGVPINNQPLNPTINGQQVNASSVGADLGADVSTYNDWGTGLNFISPDDIDNVTVLKGPTAAALYGNRGANGVILVTRKKGAKKNGLGIDYSFNDRFTSVYSNFYNFQNEYGIGYDASLWTADNDKKFPVNASGQRYLPSVYGPDNAGNYTSGTGGYLPYDNPVQTYGTAFSYPGGPSFGAKFDSKPVLWYDGVLRPYTAKPNNWKTFFPNGYVSQHNVSVSGGGDFGTVRFSYTREDNKANVLNSNYHSNVFNLGSSIKISSKLTTDITASYVNYNRLNTPPIGNTFVAGPVYGMTRDYDPAVDRANAFKPDGSQRDVFNTSNFPAGSPGYPFNGGYMDNLFWNIYKNNTQLTHNNLTAGLKLTANLTDWLTLTGQAGLDNGNDLVTTKITPKDVQGIANGRYQETMGKNQTTDLLGMARIFKDNIGGKEFNVSFTAGTESVSVDNYSTNSSTNGNFVNPFLYYLGNGADPVTTSDQRYAYKINSVFGVVDASYRNYLFLLVTGRNDWNSTLSSAYNSFFYPAASLGYVFTDGIKGLKSKAPWLSYGKLSLAYAGTGSGTTPYATNTVLDGVAYNGVAALSYQNISLDPRIKPQRTREYDLILNLGMFHNRVNIEMTAYSGTSYPQIVTNPVPVSSGVNNIRINDAKLANKGLEFIINATAISTKDFSWNISVNGAHATNKLVSLSGQDSVLTLGSYFGGNGISQRVRVGDNYGTLYGRDFTYFKGQKVVSYLQDANGSPMQYTANGHTYSAGTQWALTSNEVPIGNSQPKLTGGVANTFRYKNFSLYILTDFKLGGDTYFGSYGAAMGFGLRQETVKERDGAGLPYVHPDGTTDNTGMIMKGVFADGTPNNVVVTAPWYYTASYSSWNHIGVPRSTAVFNNSWMKFRELNLTYQIPRNIVAKTKIFQALSISLIGRDLFYIFTTIPKGLNPEGVNGIGNMQGIEYSAMPNTRSMGFSVKASL